MPRDDNDVYVATVNSITAQTTFVFIYIESIYISNYVGSHIVCIKHSESIYMF